MMSKKKTAADNKNIGGGKTKNMTTNIVADKYQKIKQIWTSSKNIDEVVTRLKEMDMSPYAIVHYLRVTGLVVGCDAGFLLDKLRERK